MGNRSDISFIKATSNISLKNGKRIQLEKYLLYKNGIRFRGGEYTIATINDTVSFIYGFFAPASNENFEKKYDLSASTKIAIEHFNNSHQIKSDTDASTGITDTSFAIYYFDYVQEKYRTAFQVQITSKNMAHSENIFISAATGKFLGAENLICTINFPGTAQTQYSGNRNIVTDAPTAAGPFRLQETRGANNVLIRTRNMNHQFDLSNVTQFFDNDNNWAAVEHGADRAAFDAHWGAETVHDYWLTEHTRNSINGTGMAIESYVHLGTNVFNARWVSSLNCIQYGDGIFGTNSLTSLDGCAHEFGHGIDQFTGDLLYERESGALDEGLADIWGACVEAWAKPTGSRWLIGEEVLGGPIRSMANPNAFGQPDTYLGTNWVSQVGCTPSFDPFTGNDGCGVHTNSGVLNFWFFLLSDGGTGTNDIGNAYNVTGLGINTAADIAYATKSLAGGTTNYPTCRALSIQAATALYGANSCEVKAVTDAWYAVGVGAAYSGTLGMVINGDGLICTTSSPYIINNLPTGATVSWSVTPAGIVTINSPNATQTTLTRVGNGIIELRATVSGTGTCGSPVVITKVVTVGSGTTGSITATYNSPSNPAQPLYPLAKFDLTTYYDACLSLRIIPTNVPSGATVTWSATAPGASWQQVGNYFVCFFTTLNQTADVNLSISTSCGSSYAHYRFRCVNSGVCGGPTPLRAIISPNPAQQTVTVTLNEENSIAAKAGVSVQSGNSITQVKIYNVHGLTVKSVQYTGMTKQVQIDIAGILPGLYFIEVSNGIDKQTSKLVISR